MFMTTRSTTPAMVSLTKAGRRYARAQAARDAALTELQEAIRSANREGGHTRSELIEAAGVARQTVYDALKGKGG